MRLGRGCWCCFGKGTRACCAWDLPVEIGMRMRICFLSDGKAEHTRRWTTFFARAGHVVHLVTWNASLLDGYAPVVVHLLKKPFAGAGPVIRALNGIALVRATKRVIAAHNIQVLHAHSSC